MRSNFSRMDRFKLLGYAILLALLCVLCSCATSGGSVKSSGMCSRMLCEPGIKDPSSLENFFMAREPDADREKVRRLAEYYVTEGAFEGINSDAAFCQMCLETGFLHFGGLVKPWMNNFCGLGTISKKENSSTFASELLGVRAHIQHLHAYACTKKLRNRVVDPRYGYVKPRGKARSVFRLSGTWAADKKYGRKLDSLLRQLEKY